MSLTTEEPAVLQGFGSQATNLKNFSVVAAAATLSIVVIVVVIILGGSA
ncbi:MAG: hypothetical protein J7L55_01995 [Desulfurococcales archaeon]|nr:hypothetical protein [Desulfurococcales archaeon]